MEYAMPVDLLHTFPLTHEQAVYTLLEAPWTPEEQKFIGERSLCTLMDPIGSRLRVHWYLDEPTGILPRHYKKRFALGDGGDMAALMILNWLAVLKEEQFNITSYVHELRNTWLRRGIDPLTLEKRQT